MRLNLSPLGTVKLGVHVVQGLLVFISICLAFAMDAQQGHSDGRGKWFNILCWLTIPALIYLAVVPMWQRSQRFANVFAFLALDALFAILWLSGWAALVSWNRAGMQSGAALKKLPSSAANCTTFNPAFGVEKKCELANTCVGFGVVLFVAFIASAVLSFLYFRKIRKDSTVPAPWLGKGAYVRPGADMEARNDNTWSADTHDLDTSANTGPPAPAAGAPHHQRSDSDGTERGGNQEEDEYQLLNNDTQYRPRPERRPWEDDDIDQHNRYDVPPQYEDTEYRGRRTSYHPQSSLRPEAYEQSSSAFPSAPYGYGGPQTPRDVV